MKDSVRVKNDTKPQNTSHSKELKYWMFSNMFCHNLL